MGHFSSSFALRARGALDTAPTSRWRFPTCSQQVSRMGARWAPLGTEVPKGAQERCCDLMCKSSKAASPKLAPCCPADPGDGLLKVFYCKGLEHFFWADACFKSQLCFSWLCVCLAAGQGTSESPNSIVRGLLVMLRARELLASD